MMINLDLNKRAIMNDVTVIDRSLIISMVTKHKVL